METSPYPHVLSVTAPNVLFLTSPLYFNSIQFNSILYCTLYKTFTQVKYKYKETKWMLSNHYAKKRECAYVGSVQRTKSCLVGHRHVQKNGTKKKEEEKISQITSVMKKHAK